MWRRRKPEEVPASVRELLDTQGSALVLLSEKMKSLTRVVDELEDHVDKRFRSMRAMAGKIASGAGPAEAEGGPPQPDTPTPAPLPTDPRVSSSKADLVQMLASRAGRS
ncbi:MAG: hypothetical protein V3T14_00155 [Myxococcota bacterium]